MTSVMSRKPVARMLTLSWRYCGKEYLNSIYIAYRGLNTLLRDKKYR